MFFNITDKKNHRAYFLEAIDYCLEGKRFENFEIPPEKDSHEFIYIEARNEFFLFEIDWDEYPNSEFNRCIPEDELVFICKAKLIAQNSW